MWHADYKPPSLHRVKATKQKGAAAVEFAMLAMLFFSLVFGVLEIARLVYLFNTLQEVTRRAAALAVNSPFDKDSQETVRKNALFADKNGNLVLGDPVTPAHVKLDYLSLSRDSAGVLTTPPVVSLPADPATNRINCLVNPNGNNCIRFVRVRICQPNTTNDCAPVPYKMLFSLIKFPDLNLPRSDTVVPAQTMGYTGG